MIPKENKGKVVLSLDQHLDAVDYRYLNSTDYKPSKFALTFMNFIKLVNGVEGEANKTPTVHLALLDKIIGNNSYVANLCFRGLGKTSLLSEYLCLYLAVFGELPSLGEVTGILYVSDSMENGVASMRESIEYRYENSDFLQKWIPEMKVNEKMIRFKAVNGRRLGIKLYGSATGIRGGKIYGKRPRLAIVDDIIGDKDAKSKTVMDGLRDVLYKGINHALDPTRRKVIFSGTPFNSTDVLVEAIESGVWDVNVWPVCEVFPCTEEEFSGAWTDRFSYEFVKEQYDMAVGAGKVSAFNQELMLRITSKEDRLIQEEDIRWYSRDSLMRNSSNFNFYITTDFATTNKSSSDYSVVSVWAYNANGDWFYVDGTCARQTMDRSIDDLFRLVQKYRPQQVGVETSGQQGAFITWLQRDMMDRNIWFNFASSNKSGAPGINPTGHGDKLKRFNLVVPWFKAGKMYFPNELKDGLVLGIFLGQLRLVTHTGIKGKDDCIDTVSMLAFMNPWKPSSTESVAQKQSSDTDLWDFPIESTPADISSYIV